MSASGERGDTLIEVLVAVAVLGIAVSALLTALGVMVSTTQSNRSDAQAQDALLTVAERAKAIALTPADVASCFARTVSVTGLPPGFTASIGHGSAAPGASGCAQLMALDVRVQGSGFDLTAQVVRRP